MTPLRIRPARPDEAASLRGLVETSIPQHESWTVFDALAAGALLDNDLVSELILIAEDRAEPGPCLGVAVAHPPTAALERAGFQGADLLHATALLVKLSAIAVDPDHRGQQIGQKILRRLIAEYRAREYRWMYGQFTATERGLDSFYARLGFDILEVDQPLDLPFGQWPATVGERWFWQSL